MFEEDKLLKDLDTPQPKRRWFSKKPQVSLNNFPTIAKKIVKTMIYTLVFCVGLFILFYVNSSLSEKDSLSWINSIPLIGQIKTFAETSSSPLKGEDRGRINILFLGIGGENHAGGQLTDTMMVFSIDTKDKKVAMLSIPRDLAVPIENMGWRKINNVNAYAEMSTKGSGGIAASQTVSEILKSPIDYYIKIDFAGFKKLIDYFGGVEIDVENTFDDYTYPANGQEENPNYTARFEHLHFDKGVQMMNAETALKYARSRHSYGVEGTDFARARRQQKVIQALKDKALSVSTLTNPTLIANIYSTLQANMSTNLKVWELLKVWNLVKNINQNNITTKVLSNQPSGLLVDTTGADGAYLLMPRTGNFTEIQYYFQHIFEAAPEQVKAKITNEQAKVRILNGTWVNGLASKMASDLEKYNFEIVNVGNCSRQNFETSVIYDLTFGAKKDSLEMLKKKTNANVSFTLPDWLKADLAREAASGTASQQPDLILILGQDVEANYNTLN
jgi:LCP family protein required for cell wall assembly